MMKESGGGVVERAGCWVDSHRNHISFRKQKSSQANPLLEAQPLLCLHM